MRTERKDEIRRKFSPVKFFSEKFNLKEKKLCEKFNLKENKWNKLVMTIITCVEFQANSYLLSQFFSEKVVFIALRIFKSVLPSLVWELQFKKHLLGFY